MDLTTKTKGQLKQTVEEKRVNNPFRRTGDSEKTIQLTIQREEEICDDRYVLLATAQIRLETIHGCSELMTALCDTGAQANLITQNCVDRLGLVKHPVKGSIRGLTGFGVHAKGQVTTSLFNRFNNQALGEIELIVVKEVMPKYPHQPIKTIIDEQITPRLANKEFNRPRVIDLLLGAEVWARIIKANIQRTQDGLTIQDSALGWLVFGGCNTTRTKFSKEIQLNLREQDELIQLMKQLCEVEAPQEKREWTKMENWCEDNFVKTVSRKHGHYYVTIPMSPENEGLGDSRNIALRRFFALENRLSKNPVLREKYIEFMREYENLDHMRKTTSPIDADKPYYYIPHHAVLKKFRVVFDASSVTTNGKSFNDIQLAGPRVQDDLYAIILQFRLGRVGINADIKKMFRQVRIDKDQRDMQRIFWREGPQQPLCEYQLTTVTYGMKSSPFNSTRALKQCGLDNASELPKAAKVIQKHFYVDDLLTTAHSKEEAMTLQREIVQALKQGGFELTKWHSNVKEIREVEEEMLTLSDKQNPSVLGLQWNQHRDTLNYKTEYRLQPEVLTKRSIARESARVFDPLGYLAPVTILAKLILQRLWRLKLDWDVPLAEEETTDWIRFHANLKDIKEIEIPRWIRFSPGMTIELHAFADASSIALGTVVYAKVANKDETYTSILTAKSRVATKGTITIPRLELAAAAMAVEQVNKIKEIEDFKNCETYFWTDSMIVLYWLRRDPEDLQVYVSNRVGKIQAATDISQWRHIASESNPADLISRGTSPKELENNQLWWHGPQLISKPKRDWPDWLMTLSSDERQSSDTELKKAVVTDPFVGFMLQRRNQQLIEIMDYYGGLERALRITAYVIRFVVRFKAQVAKKRAERMAANNEGNVTIQPTTRTLRSATKTKRPQPITKDDTQVNRMITTEERDGALKYWIRLHQQKDFPHEYEQLQAGRPIAKDSKLKYLAPYLDEDGLMRLRGRLENAPLTFDEKRPFILSYKCSLVRQMTQDAHEKTSHGGERICQQYLRQRFWILGVIKEIRRVCKRCVRCCIERQETATQMMADLPKSRVQVTAPFTHTGVDYAGPIQLKNEAGETTSKGYIAIFVCMTYKAIHLELVSSLSSETFLAALDRFVNTRGGNVRHMYSDNGRNFVGASRLLREALEHWSSEETLRHLSLQGIDWHFNPPRAPHHGGLWEAAVKSVKYHMKRVGGSSIFTFEELATLLTKIAACLNSRPISPISADPNDLTALTPGHFLTGGPMVAPLAPDYSQIHQNNLKSWQKIQQNHRDFWERWVKEHLRDIQRRNSWMVQRPNVEINSYVLLKNELTPPSVWLMGRVIEIYPGGDGLVRIVKVKTAHSEYIRPITNLVVLPLNEDELFE